MKKRTRNVLISLGALAAAAAAAKGAHHLTTRGKKEPVGDDWEDWVNLVPTPADRFGRAMARHHEVVERIQKTPMESNLNF